MHAPTQRDTRTHPWTCAEAAVLSPSPLAAAAAAAPAQGRPVFGGVPPRGSRCGAAALQTGASRQLAQGVAPPRPFFSPTLHHEKPAPAPGLSGKTLTGTVKH